MVAVIGLAVFINSLIRIALLPFDADPDDGRADILGPFKVVPGQDAEPSGVYFKIGMKPVLHAEVSDGRQIHFVHEQPPSDL
ncbi:hypothetical protein D1872_285360 [compost metagenome]